MLISNSSGILSAFGRSAGSLSGPGGVMRMALGGQTNSQSWQETHLVLSSWSLTRYGAPRYPSGTTHFSSGYCSVTFFLKKCRSVTFNPPIIVGLKVTLRHFFRKKVTLQYPEEKWVVPEGYRGAPYLVKDQEDKTKCVSCQLCEFVCPPKAIRITPPGPDKLPA